MLRNPQPNLAREYSYLSSYPYLCSNMWIGFLMERYCGPGWHGYCSALSFHWFTHPLPWFSHHHLSSDQGTGVLNANLASSSGSRVSIIYPSSISVFRPEPNYPFVITLYPSEGIHLNPTMVEGNDSQAPSASLSTQGSTAINLICWKWELYCATTRPWSTQVLYRVNPNGHENSIFIV